MSRDRPLICATHCHTPLGPGVHTTCFENCFCKIELCMEQLVETVQATVCSIRVVKQGTRCHFDLQCRVTCSTTSYSHKIIENEVTYVANAHSGEVVLLDPGKLAMPKGSFGYLDLLRRVVSVQLQGSMKVVVQAYSSSGFITAQGHISLTPKAYGFSQKKFNVDDAELEISVAWSTNVEDKGDIARQGWLFESSFLP
uniref:DUF6598 domain-containing protein n=1 Tax=Aegilops tauschii TaxID=37682 RepID=M8ATA4_AEGTA